MSWTRRKWRFPPAPTSWASRQIECRFVPAVSCAGPHQPSTPTIRPDIPQIKAAFKAVRALHCNARTLQEVTRRSSLMAQGLQKQQPSPQIQNSRMCDIYIYISVIWVIWNIVKYNVIQEVKKLGKTPLSLNGLWFFSQEGNHVHETLGVVPPLRKLIPSCSTQPWASISTQMDKFDRTIGCILKNLHSVQVANGVDFCWTTKATWRLERQFLTHNTFRR